MMRTVGLATPSATTMQQLAIGERFAPPPALALVPVRRKLKPSPRPILPMSCRMLNPLAVEKY